MGFIDEEMRKEILDFVKQCDKQFEEGTFLPYNAATAARYLATLRKIPQKSRSQIVNNLINKLQFIANQIDANNYDNYKKESMLNLVSLSVTDYIIDYVRYKKLTDNLEIARFVYIELSKVLYYDISYVKQNDTKEKRMMCSTNINPKKEKMFSYVVCTQWLQLYTYILREFGIKVDTMNIPGTFHVWGEIDLNNGNVVIVDATDYIDNSIDLSNAKSMSPTVGFAIVPKELSGINLYSVFTDKEKRDIAKKVVDCYEFNRDLDISLKYINSKGYNVEIITRENELFQHPQEFITDPVLLKRYIENVMDFFAKLKIPNNMDGYEVFAYYGKLLKKLPGSVSSRISQQTIYVDSFAYRQKKIRRKFLNASADYLKYLESLVYNRYYKYLTEEEKNNSVLDQVKNGELNNKQISDAIIKNELKIAEINRTLNLYYAINKMQFYDPDTWETLGVHLFEPMMGKKTFNDDESLEEFKKLAFVPK